MTKKQVHDQGVKNAVCAVIMRVRPCLERGFSGLYRRLMISCARHTRSAGVVWNACASCVIWLILMSRSAESMRMRVLTGMPDASDSSRTVMPAMALSAEMAFAMAWFMSMSLEHAGGERPWGKNVSPPQTVPRRGQWERWLASCLLDVSDLLDGHAEE